MGKPKNKGLSDKEELPSLAEGEKLVIKGSERIQNWQHVEGNVWKCELPNSFFVTLIHIRKRYLVIGSLQLKRLNI